MDLVALNESVAKLALGEGLLAEAAAHVTLPTTTKLVRDKLMTYLGFNGYHLPNYAK